MKTVLASGVFDILHPGHIHYLGEAKKLGDRLVVVITSDETAALQKRQPIFDEKLRANIVSHLKMVDEVVIGRPGKAYDSIIDVWPDIIATGWNQFGSSKSLAFGN
jgi:FAD synthetase